MQPVEGITLLFYLRRLQFMKVLNKYWESDLCLTKIKVNEKMKTIGFDFKNNKLAIVTHDRTIYFVDLPRPSRNG